MDGDVFLERLYATMIKVFGCLAAGSAERTPKLTQDEIVMTDNLREWRHFFKLRISQGRSQMREITVPMLAKFKELIPVIFDDINPEV